jgi:hypothetical protein
MIHPQDLQDLLHDRAETFSKEFAQASYEMGQGIHRQTQKQRRHSSLHPGQ